jgi:hypothetical protein
MTGLRSIHIPDIYYFLFRAFSKNNNIHFLVCGGIKKLFLRARLTNWLHCKGGRFSKMSFVKSAPCKYDEMLRSFSISLEYFLSSLMNALRAS